MENQFKDKCCTIIGRLQSCTREDAYDRLLPKGGVPHPRVNYLTDYVIAGTGAEGTKLYQTARELEAGGCLTILTEKQFFDALTNGAALPVNPNKPQGLIVSPGADEPEEKDNWLRDKRLGYLATKRIQTTEGEARLDLRPLYRVAEVMKQREKDRDKNS